MTSAGRMKGPAEFEANHNSPENNLRAPRFSEFVQGKATTREQIQYVCVYVYMCVYISMRMYKVLLLVSIRSIGVENLLW